MKIFYFIDDLSQSGGTERVVTTKVNWLADHPDEAARAAGEPVSVAIVTLDGRGEPFFPLSPRVERIALPGVAPGDRRSYQRALNALLLSRRPDVAVTVAGMATETLPRCTDGSRKVLEFHYTRNYLVNFVRGLHTIRFRRLHILKMQWLQWQLARTAHRYDLFVGLTHRDVGLWGNPRNMTYVHNPLSFRSERQSTCQAKRIIAVGSWTPSKGMDRLLEAFGPLARRYPDWTVELYGSGQEEYLLRQIIDRYGMGSQVSLNAPCRDIAARLVEASIYAFPSRSDGFGLVITEAMECGLPTVAMDCPCGPCEIVTDRTGIVIADGDIAAFSAALERLMSDPGLRRRMGAAARADVARFYPESILPQWLTLFRKLCQ